MLDTYLKLFDQNIFEAGEAFKGLKDENVWKRPAPGLLSVGELAGHMAYWEAIRLAGEGEDLSKCKVSSPLIDPHFRYYTSTIATAIPDRFVSLTADQVNSELVRVHEESVAFFKTFNPDLSAPVPGLPYNFTYGTSLEYLTFHMAYHTGQIYTVRNLLGEETVDN